MSTLKDRPLKKMGKRPSSPIIHSPGGEYCWIVRDSEPIILLKSPRSLSVYILLVYSYFNEGCRREWRMSNGGWTTEKNCGEASWHAKFHYLRSACVEMNTPTMNVCLNVLDSKTKRNSRFFQLKDVPGFLVWTAHYLRLCIASHEKFRNIALSRPFRNAHEKWSLCNECRRTWTNHIVILL